MGLSGKAQAKGGTKRQDWSLASFFGSFEDMSERDKRKTEWRTQSLARKDQLELERSLQKILRLEQRSAEQLALLNQHKDLAAQVRSYIISSQVCHSRGTFTTSWQLGAHVNVLAEG